MKLLRLFLMLLALPGLLAAPLAAGEHGDGLIPAIPKAVGAPHEEGNEFWRRNHMDLLRHDRDLTLRMGDRTIDASIKTCVTCHAVEGPDAEPIGAVDNGGFCSVCHKFASVKIDCFTCHKATPDEEGTQLLQSIWSGGMGDPNSGPAADAIAEYLARLKSGKPAQEVSPQEVSE